MRRDYGKSRSSARYASIRMTGVAMQSAIPRCAQDDAITARSLTALRMTHHADIIPRLQVIE